MKSYQKNKKPPQKLQCQQCLQVVQTCNRYGLLVGRLVVPAVADDAAFALILLTNWCLTKMDSRKISRKMHGKA